MTIKERIAEFCAYWKIFPENRDHRGVEMEDDLRKLLKEVAREQRRYCAESGFDIETGKYTFEAIQTARSPLNEDSRE